MHGDHDLARIGALLGDPARARMLWTLIDGTTRPAGELAFAANVSAQSASAHLARLVEGGLLRVGAQGRHRYFCISSAEVAAVVEGMASLGTATTPARPPRLARPPRESATAAASSAFRHARTCYGHLAGEMAVRILGGLLESRWLSSDDGRDFRVTRLGQQRLKALGIDAAPAHEPRRVFARACVDLTQRRPHLGGVLGEALLDGFVAKAWVLRHRRSRAVTITPQGHAGLAKAFRLTAP